MLKAICSCYESCIANVAHFLFGNNQHLLLISLTGTLWKGLSYGGLALNILHQNYIIAKVDAFFTMCMRDPQPFRLLKDEQLKSKISKEYMIHMDMSAADDEDTGDEA